MLKNSFLIDAILLGILFLLLLPTSSFCQESTVLFPVKDNTLIESSSGSFSNGSGAFIFAGRVGGPGDLTLRRAVFQFDVESALPNPVDIQDISLTLTVIQSGDGGAQNVSLHRVLSDWGEGTSSASGGQGDLSSDNDATWIHTFYPSAEWGVPGGHFVANPSATLELGSSGTFVIENQLGLLADLEFWIENPDQNFGWILLGDESGRDKTVQKIGSRENNTESQRPQLAVTYLDPALPVELTDFDVVINGDQAHLTWETLTETNNAGFEVQHRMDNATFNTLSFISGEGTTLIPNTYQYTVQHLPIGLHTFRLRQIDFDGAFAYSPEVEVYVELSNAAAHLGIYPTPFNPTTTISISVALSQDVSVSIFDLQGRKIVDLYSGFVPSTAPLTINYEATSLSSGTYLVRAIGEKFALTKAITLVN